MVQYQDSRIHLITDNTVNILLHLVLDPRRNKLIFTVSFIFIALCHGSQSVAQEPLGIPKTLSSFYEVTTIFIVILRWHLLSFTLILS